MWTPALGRLGERMKKSNNFFSLLIVLFIFLFSSCKNGDLINFYKACANNDVKTCTAILDKKKDISLDVVFSSGEPIIKSWLEKNKSPYNNKNNDYLQDAFNFRNSRNVINIIVVCNSTDVLKLLIEKEKLSETNINDALIEAVRNNNIEISQILLQNNANPNVLIWDKEFNEIPLLHFAVKKEYFEIAKLLLNFDVDINSVSKLVEENNGNVTVKYNNDETILHTAAEYNLKEIVEFIIPHNPIIDSRDHDGKTPLMLAAEAFNSEIIEILLENGADVNACDSDGCSALILLANKSYVGKNDWLMKADSAKIAKLLIKNNANKNIRDKRLKYSALQYAVKNENIPLIEVLSGLDSYEEYTPAKFNIQKQSNIGKNIVFKNFYIGITYANQTITIVNKEISDLVSNKYFNSYDYSLNINLEEKILDLTEKANKNSNDCYANFYGYIEEKSLGWGNHEIVFHVTHIL